MYGQPPLFAVFPLSPDAAVGILTAASLLYLVIVFLIMFVARTVEFKLIALGLLTGVLAVWCSQLAGSTGVSFQAGPMQPAGAVSVAAGGAEAAGALGRIAVLLTLGGVALLFWGRRTSTAPTARPEEAPRADRL